MSTATIDGARQIKPGTITNASISSGAAITNNKLAAWSQDQSAGGFKLTSLATPTLAGDAATKAYVDAIAQGLTNKLSARAGSLTNISVTYTATGGTSARGQITAAPNTVDGVSLAANDRVSLMGQTAGAQNGVWVVTTVGTGANGVWDRATDFDNESKVPLDTFIFIQEGTANSDNGFVLTNNGAIIIGGASGTVLTFSQFSGAGSIVANNGLTKTGNILNVVPGDTSLAVAVGSITVNLAAGGTLAISSGLKVATGGITANEIANTTITNAQISATAAIANTKFAAFSADQSAGGFKITSLATPLTGTDAANKTYVDLSANSLGVKVSARAASTVNVASVTYNATGGTSARGQMTTAPNTLDGVTLAANDRVALMGQTTGAQNGIYVVTTLGSGANGVWDRAADFDNESKVPLGTTFEVQSGTANGLQEFLLTNTAAIIIGGGSGTALTFIQISGLGQVIMGNGVAKSGNTLNVVPADTSLVATTGVIGVNLNGSSLVISSGLKVNSGGITSTELNSSAFSNGLTGGSGVGVSVKWSQVEIPSGTVNGANTAFTIAATPFAAAASTTDPACVALFVNGLLQSPTTDYTRSGTTLTLTSAPLTGDLIYVWYFKA